MQSFSNNFHAPFALKKRMNVEQNNDKKSIGNPQKNRKIIRQSLPKITRKKRIYATSSAAGGADDTIL